MSSSAELTKRLVEIEGKIHEGERLLGAITRARTWGFAFFIIGFLMIIFSPGYFSVISILGLLILVGSTWRINRSGKGRKDVEYGLGVYRAQRVEMQARLVAEVADEGRG